MAEYKLKNESMDYVIYARSNFSLWDLCVDGFTDKGEAETELEDLKAAYPHNFYRLARRCIVVEWVV